MAVKHVELSPLKTEDENIVSRLQSANISDRAVSKDSNVKDTAPPVVHGDKLVPNTSGGNRICRKKNHSGEQRDFNIEGRSRTRSNPAFLKSSAVEGRPSGIIREKSAGQCSSSTLGKRYRKLSLPLSGSLFRSLSNLDWLTTGNDCGLEFVEQFRNLGKLDRKQLRLVGNVEMNVGQSRPSTSIDHSFLDEPSTSDGASHPHEPSTSIGPSYSGKLPISSGHSYSGGPPTSSGLSYLGESPTSSGPSYSGGLPTSSGSSYSGGPPNSSGPSNSVEPLTSGGPSYSGEPITSGGLSHLDGHSFSSRRSSEMSLYSKYKSYLHGRKLPTLSAHEQLSIRPKTKTNAGEMVTKLNRIPVSEQPITTNTRTAAADHAYSPGDGIVTIRPSLRTKTRTNIRDVSGADYPMDIHVSSILTRSTKPDFVPANNSVPALSLPALSLPAVPKPSTGKLRRYESDDHCTTHGTLGNASIPLSPGGFVSRIANMVGMDNKSKVTLSPTPNVSSQIADQNITDQSSANLRTIMEESPSLAEERLLREDYSHLRKYCDQREREVTTYTLNTSEHRINDAEERASDGTGISRNIGIFPAIADRFQCSWIEEFRSLFRFDLNSENERPPPDIELKSTRLEVSSKECGNKSDPVVDGSERMSMEVPCEPNEIVKKSNGCLCCCLM